MFHTTAFGLGLTSNIPLPGVTRSAPTPADVAAWFGELPRHARPDAAEPVWSSTSRFDHGPVPALRVGRLPEDGHWLFDYALGVRFLIDPAGSRVRAEWREPAVFEDAAKLLLGPVLGFILRLRGVVCLHAAAVARNGWALALAGPCGAGKSTTAAALGRRGFAVLSDDVAALDETGDEMSGPLWVRPGAPWVGLRPAAVAALLGPEAALPRMTPNLDKGRLELGGTEFRFEGTPRPLAAVYVLGPRRAEDNGPRVEPLPGREALMALVGDSYSNYLLDGPMRAREFAVLGRLAAAVPVRRVTPRADLASLPLLCTTIIEDFEALTAARSLHEP